MPSLLQKKDAKVDGRSSDDAKSHPNFESFEKRLKPRRWLFFGRSLAFSIQDNAIQMSAVSHLGWMTRLLDLTKVYVPVEMKDEATKAEFISNEISEYVRSFGGRFPRINVIIGGSETISRELHLPPMKRSELSSAIEFEAQKQLPFPLEECYYDYRSIGLVQDTAGKHLRISLLAATRRLIHEKLQPFERLGLQVSNLYMGKDVLGRILPFLSGYNDDKSYALINIEHHRSEISFYRGSDLQFTHIISLGTSFLSDRADEVVFEYFSESLATEIQNSLDYYAGQFATAFENHIYIYGDLAYSDDLIGFLSNRFGFEFHRFPSEQLPSASRLSDGMRESVSSCLEVVATALNEVTLANLLPEQVRKKAWRAEIDRWGIAALMVLFLGTAVEWQIRRYQLAEANQELTELTRQIDSFKNSTLFNTYAAVKRQVAEQETFMSLARRTPSYMGLNLKELSRLTAKEIRLHHLDYRKDQEGKNLQLSGVVSSRNTPPEIILAEYIEKLSNSPFYDNITILRNVKSRKGSRFKLDFRLSLRGVS